MADHFGSRDGVIGWQIDNEYSSHASHPFDQSEHTHAAFREWLRKKYGDVDALNRAWGNQFWNQYYTDFSQILLSPSRDPGYANPQSEDCLYLNLWRPTKTPSKPLPVMLWLHGGGADALRGRLPAHCWVPDAVLRGLARWHAHCIA